MADQAAAVLGALRIDAESLDLIAATLPGDPPPTVASLPLDLATLSALHRTASLARAIKLPIRDLLGLTALTGIDPFDPAHTENAVLLVEELARIRASRFTIADLEFILLHRERPAVSGAADRRIGVVLTELRNGLAKIRAEHVVAPDPAGELTAKKLAIILGGPAAERAVGILAGTATIAAALDALPDGVEFEPPLSDRLHFDPAARQLQFLGALTTDERDTLLALSADAAYTAAVTSLFDQPRDFFREQLTFKVPLAALPQGLVVPPALDGRVSFDAGTSTLGVIGALSPAERDTLLGLSSDPAWQMAVTALSHLAFLDPGEVATTLLDSDALQAPDKFAWLLERLVPHVRELLSRGLVKERIAAALALPGVVVDQLLTRWIHAGGTEPAMTTLLALAELDAPPTRENAGEQFDALVRLIKTARIATGFKLDPEEMAYAFDSGVGTRLASASTTCPSRGPTIPGCIAPGAGSPTTSLSASAIRSVSHRSSTRSRRRSVRSTDGPAARAAHIALLSTVTGWPEVDIAHLAGPAAFDFAYPDDFGDERPLSCLRPVMDLVSTIGSAAERVTGWAGDGLDEAPGRRDQAGCQVPLRPRSMARDRQADPRRAPGAAARRFGRPPPRQARADRRPEPADAGRPVPPVSRRRRDERVHADLPDRPGTRRDPAVRAADAARPGTGRPDQRRPRCPVGLDEAVPRVGGQPEGLRQP